MTIATEESNSRVRWLRNRADETRAAAEHMNDGNSRRSLLLIAACYESMASHLENAREHLSLAKTGQFTPSRAPGLAQ